MSGFAFAMGTCLACKKTFTFHPSFVPALGGEPVCESCMELVNEKRKAMGLDPHPIHPRAYDVAEENEL